MKYFALLTDYQFIIKIYKGTNQWADEEISRVRAWTKELLPFGRRAWHCGTRKLSGSPIWKLSAKDLN